MENAGDLTEGMRGARRLKWNVEIVGVETIFKGFAGLIETRLEEDNLEATEATVDNIGTMIKGWVLEDWQLSIKEIDYKIDQHKFRAIGKIISGELEILNLIRIET